MRQARTTWVGAYHHVMNRGLNKQKIFAEDSLRSKYIQLLSEYSEKYKIRIFAYCIMDNHFHLALENSSGALSQFMKNLNGHFGNYYRVFTNSKGYVFEDRYKSTVVQNEKYLITLIKYILLNPVRSEYVSNAFNYKWSSAGEYFMNNKDSFIDKRIVENLFTSKTAFIEDVCSEANLTINEFYTRLGKILGDISFRNTIEKKNASDFEHKLKQKKIEMDIQKIINEFEQQNEVNISEINIRSKSGKRMRATLLMKLKMNSNIRYKDIIEVSLFKNLKLNSIKAIYSREKSRNVYQKRNRPQ